MDRIHGSDPCIDLRPRSMDPIRWSDPRRAGDELVTGWCMGRACGVGHQGFVDFCTLCIYIYMCIYVWRAV